MLKKPFKSRLVVAIGVTFFGASVQNALALEKVDDNTLSQIVGQKKYKGSCSVNGTLGGGCAYNTTCARANDADAISRGYDGDYRKDVAFTPRSCNMQATNKVAPCNNNEGSLPAVKRYYYQYNGTPDPCAGGQGAGSTERPDSPFLSCLVPDCRRPGSVVSN